MSRIYFYYIKNTKLSLLSLLPFKYNIKYNMLNILKHYMNFDKSPLILYR